MIKTIISLSLLSLLGLSACGTVSPVALGDNSCDNETFLRNHGCPASYSLGHVAGHLNYLTPAERNWNTGN
jgi:hypothetical protein